MNGQKNYPNNPPFAFANIKKVCYDYPMKKNQNKTGDDNDILHEIQRVGAFVEHVDEKVSVMAEMLTDVKKTQDKHTKILEKHTELLELHSSILQIHSDDLSTIKAKLDNKVDRIEFEKRIRPFEHKIA